MSAYVDRLHDLLRRIPPDITQILLSPTKKVRVPTQAFSDFLINRELGDWAEDVVQRAVNDCGLQVRAVRYGRTENLVAGEAGFREFYLSYHAELREFGKRPDLLVYADETPDEKQFAGNGAAELIEIASKAVAGFEIRSSQQALGGQRRPSDLSFTPKIEDIVNVMRWIERHEVRHYYVQVVFGAVYAISFERILELLVEGTKPAGFRIEREPRSQFKSTIYLPLDKGVLLSTEFQEPSISAFRMQLSSGRMLFGVKFSGGKVVIEPSKLKSLIQL